MHTELMSPRSDRQHTIDRLPAHPTVREVAYRRLRQLIDESKESGKVLRHMVFVLNNEAHRFYERLGFVIIEDFGAYKHMEWKSEPPA